MGTINSCAENIIWVSGYLQEPLLVVLVFTSFLDDLVLKVSNSGYFLENAPVIYSFADQIKDSMTWSQIHPDSTRSVLFDEEYHLSYFVRLMHFFSYLANSRKEVMFLKPRVTSRISADIW